MIRILVVEDNAVVRNGVCRLLKGEPDLEVSGEAENGLQALLLLQDGLKTDIVITDFNMPGMSGLELTRNILESKPAFAVIILTMHRHITYRDNALAAGAMGYLLKGHDDDNELFKCIRSVHAGNVFVSSGFPT